MISHRKEDFWDYARSKPEDSDLVGTYRGTLVGESKIVETMSLGDIILTLETNGTGQVSALPVFDSSGRRLLTSISVDVLWRVGKPYNPDGEEWWLEITLRVQSPISGAVKMLILERCPPYRFFMIVGDPDDDVGVELKRVANQ